MYDPIQSPQNNWGTYGEDDDFDIFEMSKNAEGGDMLKHAPLGDASPVEVREAESVGGPLAVLDEYYDKYVTCPMMHSIVLTGLKTTLLRTCTQNMYIRTYL